MFQGSTAVRFIVYYSFLLFYFRTKNSKIVKHGLVCQSGNYPVCSGNRVKGFHMSAYVSVKSHGCLIFQSSKHYREAAGPYTEKTSCLEL